MSTGKSLLGMLQGLFIGLGAALLLGIAAVFIGRIAFGQEAIPTRPARLGEQDRSLGTWATEYNDDEFLRDLDALSEPGTSYMPSESDVRAYELRVLRMYVEELRRLKADTPCTPEEVEE